jgi:curved DNA-binding protein
MADGTTRVDYWQVLGLEPGADAASLKRAFREQARRWHPDLNGNDAVAEERFKQVNEAYAVLSDPRRRRAWERGEEGGADGPPPDPFAEGFPSFETYLDRLFQREPPARSRGAAPDYGEGSQSMGQPGGFQEEPVAGPTAPPAEEAGWPGGAEAEPAWRGGPVTASPPPPPPVRAATDRETVVPLSPEQALAGTTVELELADGLLVEVTTPPGAGDGWRLRLAGVTPGGGDHFLQLRVRTEEGLRIEGLRVHYLLELEPADAALGCQAVVPTLEGPVRLRVPPGSSSGRMLRLRGRGLREGERSGDQIVELRIVVPPELSDAEQALYRRLRQLAQEQQEAAAESG